MAASLANSTYAYDNQSLYRTMEHLNNGEMNTSNATNLGRDEDLAQIEIALQASIFVMTIVGNTVLLSLLIRQLRHTKLSRMYLFFMHLCIADLSVGFFNILPQMAWDVTYRFQGNTALCKIVKYLQMTTWYASTYVLCMTAIDRFLAICHPLTSHAWSSHRCHVMVAVAWGLSLLFAIPNAVVFRMMEVKENSGVYDCWETFSTNNTVVSLFTAWYVFSLWVLPTIILIVTYGFITRTVFRSMRRKESTRKKTENNNLLKRFGLGKHSKRNASNGDAWSSSVRRQQGSLEPLESGAPRAHVGKLSNAKIKTVKLTVCVVITYIVCWSPLFIMQIWWNINPDILKGAGSFPVFTLLLLLGGLNSCTNPWIYFAFNSNLRRRFARRRDSEAPDCHRNTSYSARTHVTTASSSAQTSVADSTM